MMDSINLYKPNPVVNAYDFDENLPDEELTFDLFKKFVLAKRTQDILFLTIGKMLKLVRDRRLYKHLDFDNFTQFLASEEVSFSREKAYLYIRTFELFVEKLHLDPMEVGKLGVARLMLIAPVIKDMSIDDALEKIEETKPLRYGEFVREIKNIRNISARPNVYFSEEYEKWIIQYFEDKVILEPLGKFKEDEQV